MNQFGSQYGWVPAVERLIALRQMCRLRGLTLIAIEPVSDWQPGVENRFWDNVTGFYYAEASNSYEDYDNVARRWKAYLQETLDELTRLYAADLAVVHGWQHSIVEMIKRLPPQAPQDPVKDLVSGWASEAPTPQSFWFKARQVRYAFSYENATGNGVRSAWSDWVPVNRRWKPTLRQLPRTNEDPSILKLNVWRQFLLPTETHEQTYDLPMIVGSLAPIWIVAGRPSVPFTDNDLALPQ
jgi:hypothetical protein